MNATATATRRSLRDWAVDGSLFLLAALSLVLTAAGRVEAPRQPEPAWVFPST